MTPTEQPKMAKDNANSSVDQADLLRKSIQAATDAAQRLADSVTGGEWDPGRPPRRGYAVPDQDQTSTPTDSLAAFLEIARLSLPPDLAAQFAELIKELLLALKALAEWALDSLSQGTDAAADIQEIPIT